MIQLFFFLFFSYSTASQVLLATLSIPIAPVPSEIDRFLEIDNTSRDKARRLAALLRIATPPTRASLLHDMVCILRSHMVATYVVFYVVHGYHKYKITCICTCLGTPQCASVCTCWAPAAAPVLGAWVQPPTFVQEGISHPRGTGVRWCVEGVRWVN